MDGALVADADDRHVDAIVGAANLRIRPRGRADGADGDAGGAEKALLDEVPTIGVSHGRARGNEGTATRPARAAYFGRAGLIMMCAPGVPGNISHGAPGPGVVGRPVDSDVAPGV